MTQLDPNRSFVTQLADLVYARFPSDPLSTGLAIVAELAKRQRLAAVVAHARGNTPCVMSPIDDVLAHVCRRMPVTSDELLSHSQVRRLTVPRAVAWTVLRRHMRMSLPEIGERFGRDHTTIKACVDRFRGRPEVEVHVDAIIEQLRANLEQAAEAAE